MLQEQVQTRRREIPQWLNFEGKSFELEGFFEESMDKLTFVTDSAHSLGLAEKEGALSLEGTVPGMSLVMHQVLDNFRCIQKALFQE